MNIRTVLLPLDDPPPGAHGAGDDRLITIGLGFQQRGPSDPGMPTTA